MNEQEKLALIEECMDLAEGTLRLEDNLEDYEEWDSVTVLSIIALCDEKFHKVLSGNMIKGAKTVADLLALME